MNYRSKLDIMADILFVVSQRARKTQIMYQANLSYKLLTKYLAEAKKAYLIRFKRGERRYELTTRGEEFLQRYREYSKRNRNIERQLSDIHTKRKALEKLCSNK